jgi:hypothetical protein
MTRLHTKNLEFIRLFLPALQPARLDTLRGPNVAEFLKLFPNWLRDRAIPETIDVCAINFDPFETRAEPWIYAANSTNEDPNPREPPLAGPIPSVQLFDNAEKQTQNAFYTAGFVIMVFGSLLSLIYIVAGG